MRFSPENLVNIQGSYGILDQYLWMSVVPQTWPSKCKSAQKRQLSLGTVSKLVCTRHFLYKYVTQMRKYYLVQVLKSIWVSQNRLKMYFREENFRYLTTKCSQQLSDNVFAICPHTYSEEMNYYVLTFVQATLIQFPCSS